MALAKAKWFDDETYMSNKLAAMRETEGSAYTMDTLLSAFNKAGFKGEEGHYKHFQKYGRSASENLSPNENFDQEAYYKFKAAEYYHVADVNDVTDYQASNMKAAIEAAGMSAWTHYIRYGTAEGINCSNTFDTEAYMADKLKVMQAKDPSAGWTAGKLAAAFRKAGLNALEHFLQYAGSGDQEVPSSDIGDYEVPDGEKIAEAEEGETFILTTDVNNFTGTGLNDTFIATDPQNASSSVMNPLDMLDGRDGDDLLQISDALTAPTSQTTFNGISVSNIENVVATTTGAFNVDMSDYTGLESATLKSITTKAVAHAVKAGDDVDLSLTTSNASAVTVRGGQNVSVTGNGGAVTVTGDGLTSVTLRNADDASTVSNGDAGEGITLKNVVLDNIASGDAMVINGNAVQNLTIQNTGSGNLTVTLGNTKSTSLNLTVNNAGYRNETALYTDRVVTGSAVTDVTIATAGTYNSLDLDSAKAASVKITGDGARLLLDLDDSAKVSSLNASSLTGAVGYTVKSNALTSLRTGSGNDEISVSADLKAGTTVSLGAGDDVLSDDGGSVAKSTSSAATLIDGGAGYDTLALSLVNVDNAKCFTNFDVLDVAGAGSNMNLKYLNDNNNITTIVASGPLDTSVTLSNFTGGTLHITGDMGSANVLTLNQSNADTIKLIFLHDVTTDVANANKASISTNADVVAAYFECDSAHTTAADNTQSMTVYGTAATELLIQSDGTNATNSLTFETVAGSAYDKLSRVHISGEEDLTLTLTPATTKYGVNDFNASGLRGDLTFIGWDEIRNGTTINMGSGDDAFALAKRSTVSISDDDAITLSGFAAANDKGQGNTSSGFDKVVILDDYGKTSLATTVDGGYTGGKVASFTNSVVSWSDKANITSLENAIQEIAAAIKTENKACLFEFAGEYYFYGTGSDDEVYTDDYLVCLVGMDSVKGLALIDNDAIGGNETADTSFYIYS